MPVPVRRAEKGSRLTSQEGDDHLDYIDRPTVPVLVISSGLITITGPGLYRVETEAAASADDLTGILGGAGREWPVILTLNTAGRVITVVHTSPNFLLAGGATFYLNTLNDSIEFRDRSSGLWREMHRSGVP